MSTYSTQYGVNDEFFGHADYYEAKKTGASDADILNYLEKNPQVLRGGNVSGKGGLFDEIKSSAQSSADKYTGQITAAEGERDRYKDRVDEYSREVGNLRDQISGLNTQIGGFNTEIADYKTKVKNLTGQYEEALSTAEKNALARDDFEKKFSEATELYELEKQEADRYREEAVGQQLRAVRAGRTAGGGRQTDQMRGSLASGRTGFSSEDRDISDLAESMRSQGGLTDSVLSREGPVVQQLSRSAAQGSGGGQRQMRSSAGSGSYYASRFR